MQVCTLCNIRETKNRVYGKREIRVYVFLKLKSIKMRIGHK